MGKARGHLTERAEAGYMKEICLQFLQLRLRFESLGQITYEPRKMPLESLGMLAVLDSHLAH
jgi:hypothetical protein